MPSPIKMHSINRTLLISIIGFTFFFLSLTAWVMINAVIKSEHAQLEQNTKAWAKIIAINSIGAIKADEHNRLQQELLQLTAMEYINYVHIYRYTEDKSTLEYFTSFNKNINFPAIPDKSNQIELLAKPHHANNYLEYMYPIQQNNDLYGYLYIQTNKQNLDLFINSLVISAVILISLAVLMSLLIAMRLNRKITDPISKLTDNISDIFQTKNYGKRCDVSAYRELDILAKNINILLTRVEKNIEQQHKNKMTLDQRNESLENKISRRNRTIEEINQEHNEKIKEWQEYQDHMLETEKLASLGSMVAGIAHEVNTPIGLGVTASTLLADRLEEINTAFNDKTLKSSQLRKFLADGHENIDIIYRNLIRAADLISSFKKLAVDQSSEEDRQFNVKSFINDILLTLAPQLKNAPININLICPNDLVITCKPGPINQIIINLILNSHIHAFEGIEHGEITITIMDLGDQLNLNYQDNGIGVCPEIKDKVFDPFITTKRGAGGSGLGLHLVYNLVTQALTGTINFESQPNQGVVFDINFPVVKNES